LRDAFQIRSDFHAPAKGVAGRTTLVEDPFRFDRLCRVRRAVDYNKRQREEKKQGDNRK
jgi:hypothetical protein